MKTIPAPWSLNARARGCNITPRPLASLLLHAPVGFSRGQRMGDSFDDRVSTACGAPPHSIARSVAIAGPPDFLGDTWLQRPEEGHTLMGVPQVQSDGHSRVSLLNVSRTKKFPLPIVITGKVHTLIDHLYRPYLIDAFSSRANSVLMLLRSRPRPPASAPRRGGSGKLRFIANSPDSAKL